MKKSKLIIIWMVMIFTLVGCGVNNGKPSNDSNNISNKQLTEKEKLDDFEYMYTIIKENYPYLEVNKRLNGVDWLAKKDDYINRIKATPNDESFFNTLNVILSDLNNGHTQMLNKKNYSYIKSVCEKNSEIDQAWLEQMNKSKTVERYSCMKEKDESKSSSEIVRSNNVKTMDLEKGKIAYLAIHSFNTFNIDEDMKIIKPYLEQIKNYNDLIIDIRGNGGGDDKYWIDNIVPMLINEPLKEKLYLAFRGGDFLEPFVENRMGGYKKLEPISDIYDENLKNLPPELKEDFKYYLKIISNYEPKNSVGFKGKIYLLVDKYVFSSSEEFAIFAKSTGFATLVGEKTGGDGLGDDPAVCALPNSGYVFRFTQEMGLVSDGACNFENKTEPDIIVPAEGNSDISKDQVIQTVLKLVN
ncbi:S41 family peptidase [Clostridium sp.]|uniref:S41 family peptidase n=1 Tax=Clostridium sp. TaxID=1506 RepID=UPI00283EC2C8|nr:S41 family peptidase [Clostridium sp.]MDR3595618.1 S41 family peptidase [Clostridium sp.]